jgi:hypothetical protein
MIIRIPAIVTRSWDAFVDWGDVLIWRYRRLELRRIDLVIAAFFTFCVSWYAYFYSWGGAVKGGAAFIFIATCALLFRR